MNKFEEIRTRLLEKGNRHRDASIKEIDAHARGYLSGVFDALDMVAAAEQQAQNAPEPVVHGRWFKFKETDSCYVHMRCSVCSAYWSDPSHADHFRYCPNCGAKMEGEE